MLSGHETADFSSIQIAALIITDHYRANYYLAEFFVKHSTHKIEPFYFKKRSKTCFFYIPRSLKITWSSREATYCKIRSVRIFEKVSNEYSHMTWIRLSYQLFNLNRTSLTFRDVASFLASCRPGWLSFPHILKIARMTSTHWPHQHFELLCFFSWLQQRIICYKR